jgi:hypothetical protein
LLRNTSKPQDGLVSIFLNRPISRSVSRFLVRIRLFPSEWTLLLTVFPIAGSVLLTRGDYFGFALGAIFFQVYSALDGCDGEIARAKYLDSEKGGKFDTFCDQAAGLLFAICLGIGLSRQPGIADSLGRFYLWEGITTALLVGISEWLLNRATADDGRDLGDMNTSLYPRYVRVIKGSGVLFLGGGVVKFFVQATKRDVQIFAFTLFALCGRPQWILHILATCAIAGLLLAVKALLTPTPDGGHAGGPPSKLL